MGSILYIFSEYNCFEMADYPVGCSDEICEFAYCQDQYKTPIYRILN